MAPKKSRLASEISARTLARNCEYSMQDFAIMTCFRAGGGVMFSLSKLINGDDNATKTIFHRPS